MDVWTGGFANPACSAVQVYRMAKHE